MSSKSARRRKRKSNVNYTNKFQLIEQSTTVDPSVIIELLCFGYIRKIKKTSPYDIAQLCHWYFDDDQIIYEKLKSITPISTLQLDEKFNSLSIFQKRLICKQIMNKKQGNIVKLAVWFDDNKPVFSKLSDVFYFVEYALFKRYNTIETLDLSSMEWTDAHVLYFCNMISNIINSRKRSLQANTMKKNSLSIKHSKQRPDCCIKNTRNAATNGIKIQSKNKKSNTKLTRTMKLQELNLSCNCITDKYIGLLLKTIRLYMPQLKMLNLSENMITDAALSTIMKCRSRVKELAIELTHCKRVTLKALNEYQKQYYEPRKPIIPYCYLTGNKAKLCFAFGYMNRVAMENEREEQYTKLKKISGKGKKFQAWNRKSGLCNELWWDCR